MTSRAPILLPISREAAVCNPKNGMKISVTVFINITYIAVAFKEM